MELETQLKEFTRYSELKQLAYNIAVLQQQKMFRSLAVLSFYPAEGKTLACAALAMAYVDACHAKVLVVDTTTIQNDKSLALKECLSPSVSMIEVMSLEELRNGSNGYTPPTPAAESRGPKGPVLEPEVVFNRPLNVTVKQDNDFALIKRVASERSKQYGLVLLDTCPLTSKNKSNIDPLLVAHLSDASLVVVGQKLLNSPQVNACLNVLHDPTLHLIGMISNEAYNG